MRCSDFSACQSHGRPPRRRPNRRPICSPRRVTFHCFVLWKPSRRRAAGSYRRQIVAWNPGPAANHACRSCRLPGGRRRRGPTFHRRPTAPTGQPLRQTRCFVRRRRSPTGSTFVRRPAFRLPIDRRRIPLRCPTRACCSRATAPRFRARTAAHRRSAAWISRAADSIPAAAANLDFRSIFARRRSCLSPAGHRPPWHRVAARRTAAPFDRRCAWDRLSTGPPAPSCRNSAVCRPRAYCCPAWHPRASWAFRPARQAFVRQTACRPADPGSCLHPVDARWRRTSRPATVCLAGRPYCFAPARRSTASRRRLVRLVADLPLAATSRRAAIGLQTVHRIGIADRRADSVLDRLGLFHPVVCRSVATGPPAFLVVPARLVAFRTTACLARADRSSPPC